MKLLVATASAIVLGLVIGSCSINHRSGDFTTCNRQSDCPNNLICEDNLCVSPGGGDDGGTPPDARPDAGNQCPSQCTSCKLESKTCIVDCAVSPGTCNNEIKCPEGFNCDIRCTVGNSCRNGIDCQAGASCTINCSGQAACRNVVCGTGPCDTSCTGLQACRNIACGDSCACDVTCSQQALCDGVTCTSFQCGDFNRGCSSQQAGCNTCP